MTTPTESIRNAIVTELRRQAAESPRVLPHLNIWFIDEKRAADINGSIDLDALAAAIAEHV